VRSVTTSAQMPRGCRDWRVALALLALGHPAAGQAAVPEAAAKPGLLQVIPAPASAEFRDGRFRLADGVVIHAQDAEAEPVARYLAGLLRDVPGIRAEVS
jgi:glycosyl hydrolase family 20